MKIGILVDSSAIYDVLKFKDTNIESIPLHIITDKDEDFHDINEIVDQNNLLKRVSNGENIKTSQASPGELENKYDEMLTKYDHIIHIPITQNLSSMLQTSLIVSDYDKYKDKVTVYKNTDIAAQAISQIAFKLSKAINDKTITNVQQAIEFIDKWKDNVYIAIIPGDLKKLSRGGRATSVIATVLNILKTKLLIVWGKEPKKEAFGRTYGALAEKAIKSIKKKFDNDKYKLFFLTTPLTSNKIIANIEQVLNESKIEFLKDSVPNIYIIHAGVDTVAFIAIKE